MSHEMVGVKGVGAELTMSDVCTLQFYREKPGDLGIADLSDVSRDDDLEHSLPDALLILRHDPNLPLDRRPLRARAIAKDGATLSEIEVVGLERLRNVRFRRHLPEGMGPEVARSKAEKASVGVGNAVHSTARSDRSASRRFPLGAAAAAPASRP